jgi:hypothetical protein
MKVPDGLHCGIPQVDHIRVTIIRQRGPALPPTDTPAQAGSEESTFDAQLLRNTKCQAA